MFARVLYMTLHDTYSTRYILEASYMLSTYIVIFFHFDFGSSSAVPLNSLLPN